MDINRLAIFISEVGGYTEAESLLGLDADLLEKAVAGETLSDYEETLIENGYSNTKLEFYDNKDYIDYNYINSTSEKLNLVEGNFNADLYNDFRQAIAEGQVDLDSFNDYGQKLLIPLTNRAFEFLVDWLNENENRNAKEFLDLYNSDLDFYDLETSEFWEWFREHFYPDE